MAEKQMNRTIGLLQAHGWNILQQMFHPNWTICLDFVEAMQFDGLVVKRQNQGGHLWVTNFDGKS